MPRQRITAPVPPSHSSRPLVAQMGGSNSRQSGRRRTEIPISSSSSSLSSVVPTTSSSSLSSVATTAGLPSISSIVHEHHNIPITTTGTREMTLNHPLRPFPQQHQSQPVDHPHQRGQQQQSGLISDQISPLWQYWQPWQQQINQHEMSQQPQPQPCDHQVRLVQQYQQQKQQLHPQQQGELDYQQHQLEQEQEEYEQQHQSLLPIVPPLPPTALESVMSAYHQANAAREAELKVQQQMQQHQLRQQQMQQQLQLQWQRKQDQLQLQQSPYQHEKVQQQVQQQQHREQQPASSLPSASNQEDNTKLNSLLQVVVSPLLNSSSSSSSSQIQPIPSQLDQQQQFHKHSWSPSQRQQQSKVVLETKQDSPESQSLSYMQSQPNEPSCCGGTTKLDSEYPLTEIIDYFNTQSPTIAQEQLPHHQQQVELTQEQIYALLLQQQHHVQVGDSMEWESDSRSHSNQPPTPPPCRGQLLSDTDSSTEMAAVTSSSSSPLEGEGKSEIVAAPLKSLGPSVSPETMYELKWSERERELNESLWYEENRNPLTEHEIFEREQKLAETIPEVNIRDIEWKNRRMMEDFKRQMKQMQTARKSKNSSLRYGTVAVKNNEEEAMWTPKNLLTRRISSERHHSPPPPHDESPSKRRKHQVEYEEKKSSCDDSTAMSSSSASPSNSSETAQWSMLEVTQKCSWEHEEEKGDENLASIKSEMRKMLVPRPPCFEPNPTRWYMSNTTTSLKGIPAASKKEVEMEWNEIEYRFVQERLDAGTALSNRLIVQKLIRLYSPRIAHMFNMQRLHYRTQSKEESHRAHADTQEYNDLLVPHEPTHPPAAHDVLWTFARFVNDESDINCVGHVIERGHFVLQSHTWMQLPYSIPTSQRVREMTSYGYGKHYVFLCQVLPGSRVYYNSPNAYHDKDENPGDCHSIIKSTKGPDDDIFDQIIVMSPRQLMPIYAIECHDD